MTVSPYDDYPYPEPTKYPIEQLKDLRVDSAPRAETWEQWWPGEEPSPKKVLVIGCGVYEAIAVAAQEPLLDVLGLDASAKVIEIARDLAERGGVYNVRFVHADFLGWGASPALGYDLICASGVLHHVVARSLFIERVRVRLKPNGLFSVFVYGDRAREFVAPFCGILKDIGVPRNAHGIKFVRGLIASLQDHHPVKQFQAAVADNDAQIADLWLHPYFKQYGADELLWLMENSGLKFQRWLDPRVADYGLFEELPEEFSDLAANFARLDFARKSRVGQILNHADLKLAAVFQK